MCNYLTLIILIVYAVFQLNNRNLITLSLLATCYYTQQPIILGLLLIYIPFHILTKDNITRFLTFICLYGVITLITASNLFHIYLLIELISLISYLLATSYTSNAFSITAAITYFTMGSVASGFILMGIAIIYLTTGVFDLSNAILFSNYDSYLYTLGLLIFLVGILFKLGAFPFYTWMIDVYTLSPTLVTCFYSIYPKFGLLYILFYFTPIFDITYFAIISMIIGSIAALFNSNLKSLLAYSSLTNIGYFLIAVNHNNQFVTYIYLVTYSLVLIGLFSIILLYPNLQLHIYHLNKISNKYIKLSIILLVWALAGLPPTSLFFTKVLLFNIAINNSYEIFAIIIASIISVSYYLKIAITSNYKFADITSITYAPQHNNYLVISCSTILAFSIFLFFLSPSS